MNDFREFSKEYNDYLCHAASTGHMTAKGDKNLISAEDPKEPPKHYAYRLARSGWTFDSVKQLCERYSHAYDSPANHKYWSEVLRIFKENYVQHSYNDFRDVHEDYLMHFGILGMKWGVRRYQNPDGTLTDAGKARYDKLLNRANERQDQLAIKRGFTPGKYADFSDSKYKNLVKKANKYGRETAEERNQRIERDKQAALERNKQKIEEANKIDLEDVKNKIPMKEVKDKWEKAAKQDTYDLDFLEITQNDYDEMPEEAAKKQRLKDYSDYLNAQKLNSLVVDKHKQSSDLDNAADLGLKAFNKINPNFNDSKPGDPGSRDWFTYEDQTVGYTEVADLCKKMKDGGYNKKDVLNTLKGIKDNKFLEIYDSEGLWDLDYFMGSEITGKYAQEHGKPGENYINAIWAILESEGKINHSAVDEIFEKFGII